MVLKLVGVPYFAFTQLVAAILHEKQVPFDNDDDGFILFESRAIARYIEEKYPNQGPELIPTGLREKAIFEQAASVELNNFNPYAMGAVYENLVKRYFGREPDPAVFQEKIQALEKTLDVYDAILSKQKYLAGETVTLVDLFHLPYSSLLSVAGSDVMTSRPNVARWYTDITSRASWQSVKDGIQTQS